MRRIKKGKVKISRYRNKSYPVLQKEEGIDALRKRELLLRQKLNELITKNIKDLVDCLNPVQTISILRANTRNLSNDLESIDRYINSLEKVSRKIKEIDIKNNKQSYYIEGNSFETTGNQKEVFSSGPTKEYPNPVWGYDDYGSWKIMGYGK